MLRYWLIALCAVGVATDAAEPPPWSVFLAGVAEEAVAGGVSRDVVDAAFDGLEPDPRVLGFDRKQPEFVQTTAQYLVARVTKGRIESARKHYAAERATLEAVGERYGVDAPFIVALWGVESSFGRYQGKYSIIRSVATLAHDRRRSAFFRSELLQALRILDEGHVPPEQFVGGWAGAMGQNQFMPSSFRRYAQDFDGNGRKDIWQNRGDVWASIAFYLAEHGWRQGKPWGYVSNHPDGFDFTSVARQDEVTRCRAERSLSAAASAAEWRRLGFELPEGAPVLRLVKPEAGVTETYFAAANFETILRYNCANKYAISVGLLADAVEP